MNKLPRSGNPFIDAILIAIQGVGATNITREGNTIFCEYAGEHYRFNYAHPAPKLDPSPDDIQSCIDALILLGAIPAISPPLAQAVASTISTSTSLVNVDTRAA
jgi:hypothetical protein